MGLDTIQANVPDRKVSMFRALPFAALLVSLGVALASTADAQPSAEPGVSDNEIKLGQTMPYSGPNSAYATVGRTEAAVYRMINEQGGIAGRRINMISLDDAFNPAKTVEQTRKLVESDNVLAIVGSLGTAPNSAIHQYLNAKKVPHLFLSTGASKWGNPKEFPWTMGFQPTYLAEGRVYGRYILANHPNARVGVLYLNDDLGKDYLRGLLEGLGSKAAERIVAKQSFELGDPTVDSQIVSLKASGADVFVNIATPKAAVQAIRKAAQIGWKPVHFLAQISSSIETVMKPVGPELSTGIYSVSAYKDVSDPAHRNERDVQEYLAFMRRYYPEGNPDDMLNIGPYIRAHALVHVLRQCGRDLTRTALMKQAASLADLRLPLLLEGIRLNTSATDFYPIEEFRMVRFDGQRWIPLGSLISGH